MHFTQGKKCAKSFQRTKRWRRFLQESLRKNHKIKQLTSKKRRRTPTLNAQRATHCALLLCITLSFSSDTASASFDQSVAVRSFGWKFFFASAFVGLGLSWAIVIAFIFAINSVLWTTIPRRHNSSITSSRQAFATFPIYTFTRRTSAQWVPRMFIDAFSALLVWLAAIHFFTVI